MTENNITTDDVVYPDLKTVKAVFGLVVQIGTGRIIHKIIENNVTATSRLDKITIPAASYALAGIVKMRVRQFSDSYVDERVRSIYKVKKIVSESDLPKEAQKLTDALDGTIDTLKEKQAKRQNEAS